MAGTPQHPVGSWLRDHQSQEPRCQKQHLIPKPCPASHLTSNHSALPKINSKDLKQQLGAARSQRLLSNLISAQTGQLLRVPQATSAPERTSGVSGYFLPGSEPLSAVFVPFLSVQARIRSPKTAGHPGAHRTLPHAPCPRTDRQTDTLAASGGSPLGAAHDGAGGRVHKRGEAKLPRQNGAETCGAC